MGIGSASAAALRMSTSAADTHRAHKRSDDSRTTVIVLSTVLSVFGCLLIVGVAFTYFRCRRRRTQLFSRAISPIDDDEIATWKGNRHEKELERDGRPAVLADRNGHQKNESAGSARKPLSVIVYPNSRRSEERSPRLQSYYGKRSLDGRKISFDKEVPSTPILARAPNAREGLTDETVPGDDPFVQSPKRQASRLSKMPPPPTTTPATSSTIQHPRQAHTRNKSARSSFSLRSFGDHFKSYDSDLELTPRTSQDHHHDVNHYHLNHQDGPSRHHGQTSRVLASEPVPPRSSASDDWPGPSGLSPAPHMRHDDIGRAIG